MSRLQGKVCLVTGAASGIGAASAALFATQGAQVIALDVDAGPLTELARSHPQLVSVVADVCSDRAVSDVVAKHARIDVLFNCAGTVVEGNALACSDDDWRRCLELNVTAVFRSMRAVLPGMVSRGMGSIINMASVISSMGSAPDRFAYAASKAAVIGMTRSVSRDFAGKGIRCNAVCPSAVDTPSMRERIERMPDPEAAHAAFSARQPVGRMARPDEIAQLAVYLASDESLFTTGASLVIDGGTWA